MRRLSPTSAAITSIVIALSTGVGAIAAEPDGLGVRDREELLGYARDTWRSVAAMADGSELPVDGLRHLVNGTWKPSPKTTPTDIASYLWSVLAAERLKIIGPDEAHRRLERTLGAMGRLERAHGFFYQWLDPRTGAVLETSPYGGEPIPPILSCVDNGWLAAALIMVRNACPPLARAGRRPAGADGLRLLLCRLRRGRSRRIIPARFTGPIASTGRRSAASTGSSTPSSGSPATSRSHADRSRPSIITASNAPSSPARGSSPRCRKGRSGPTWASRSSRGTTRTGGCGSSRAGAAACSRT